MSIPDAIIEAAAEASHNTYEDAATRHGWETQERSRKPWADVPEENKATVREAIRAAIEAAMPAIREAIAQEIADYDPRSHNPPLTVENGWGMTIAASIVRGGTP